MAEDIPQEKTRPDKVINLGLPKSGTTTLGEALKKAGYRVADWKIRGKKPAGKKSVGGLIYSSYFRGKDPLARLRKFDAISQMDIVRGGANLWPQMDYGLLMKIREYHPTVKFLLSYRDPEALSDSMMRWSDLGRKRLKVHTIPGLPLGYGHKGHQREKWINGHYLFLRKVFADDPNFLEYDITDPEASLKIGDFLGCELPWWGRANAGRKPVEKMPESDT